MFTARIGRYRRSLFTSSSIPRNSIREFGCLFERHSSFSVCPLFSWWSDFFESTATMAQDRGGVVAFNPSICALKSPPVAFHSGSDARFNRASPLSKIFFFFGCHACSLFAPVSTCGPSPCVANLGPRFSDASIATTCACS